MFSSPLLSGACWTGCCGFGLGSCAESSDPPTGHRSDYLLGRSSAICSTAGSPPEGKSPRFLNKYSHQGSYCSLQLYTPKLLMSALFFFLQYNILMAMGITTNLARPSAEERVGLVRKVWKTFYTLSIQMGGNDQRHMLQLIQCLKCLLEQIALYVTRSRTSGID